MLGDRLNRRYLFSRSNDSTRVDFVRDRGPQLLQKCVRDGVAMGTVEEIIANKITVLASRSEIRDVVVSELEARLRKRALPPIE